MAATQDFVTVQLSHHAAALLDEAQKQRGLDSPSDVLEEVLSEHETPEQIAYMREIWKEAMDNATHGPYLTEEEVFGPIEARLQAMIEAEETAKSEATV